MGADYTIWKLKTKERLILWTGIWNDILNIRDCELTVLRTNREHIISKLRYYEFQFPEKVADIILDFCGDDKIVLTSDCGREYFSEEDVYNGIKDSYNIVADISEV